MFITTPELAKILGLRPGSIHAMLYEGKLDRPKARIGQALGWSIEEVKAAQVRIDQIRRGIYVRN
jgi:predicted DNA-binding transcriptional regulator AlpA